MKALLGSLLFLATLVMACNAVCYTELKKGLSRDGCVDSDGKKHPFNSHWVKDCRKCYCEPDAITCCTEILTPVNYDKKKCLQIFNSKNCAYRVVEKKNPKKLCRVKGWVL